MSASDLNSILGKLHDVILYTELGRLTQQMLQGLLEHQPSPADHWPMQVSPLNQETADQPATYYQLRTLIAQLARGLVTEQNLDELLLHIRTKDTVSLPCPPDFAANAIAGYIWEFSPEYRRKAEEHAAHNAEVLRRMREQGRA